MAHSLAFTHHGNLVFTGLLGNDKVIVLDAYKGDFVFEFDLLGKAPQGLLVKDDKIFIHNFLSREVAVYSMTGTIGDVDNMSVNLAATVSTVASETLSAQVLRGKQVFYSANKNLTAEGYVSCATCHVDGGHDGRTWDFTDRGEGLRNTITLRGRRGTGHGNVHWTGNFDEIHDFEHDIRDAFGGSGLLDDAEFYAGSRDVPMGDPKAGIFSDLDALAAYVASLADYPRSPHRNADGSMTQLGPRR